MAKRTGRKQAKAQLQRVIERLVAKVDRLWAAIERGRAVSKRHWKRREKIKQLDPNSPETKIIDDKLSKDSRQLRDQWYKQVRKFRGVGR